MSAPRYHCRCTAAAGALALLVALVAAWPSICGRLATPPGWRYLWSAESYDNNTYLAKMRPGVDGAWRSVNAYSSEDFPAVALFPFHVALGWIAGGWQISAAALSGAAPPAADACLAVYNLARWLLPVALMLAVYGLTGRLTTRPGRRLWMMAYAAFASGALPIDGNTETSVLRSCACFPHFTAALILIVWAGGAFLDALRGPAGRPWPAVRAAVAGFGLAWIHPFDLPPLALAGALALAARWIQSRRFPRPMFFCLLAFALAAAGPALSQMSLKWRFPLFAKIEQQNQLRWVGAVEWIETLELLLILAVVGVAALWKRRAWPGALFTVCWIGAGLLAMNAPVYFQRRMVEGLPLALAFAAVAGLERYVARPFAARPLAARALAAGTLVAPSAVSPSARLFAIRPRWRRARFVALALGLALLLPRTASMLLRDGAGLEGSPGMRYALADSEVEAMAWLANQGQWREAVWAPEIQGNLIPFLGGHRVFVGHWCETVDFAAKKGQTDQFFRGRLPRGEFRRILRDYRIEYLYVPLHEPWMGRFPEWIADYDPETLGDPVFRNESALIYRVRP